ncbi:MAG: hypothetical protein HZC22_14530 [Rhodocyclales bacterium]|nr:hypothetical protein [Rhodocyclales bacterium]
MKEEFNGFRWHDNAIHGVRLVESADGYSGDLMLDIDFIVEWLPPLEGSNEFRFHVAPADLCFQRVSKLVLALDWTSSAAIFPPITIHEVRRDPVVTPNGEPSFEWRIETNHPPEGFISFRSAGYVQTERKPAVTTDQQHLSQAER